MKFVNGYFPGFEGAEGWGLTEDFAPENFPFYAELDNGVIIVDAGGVSVHLFDETETDEFGNVLGWGFENPIETFDEAKYIVSGLESLSAAEIIENAKLTGIRVIR